MTADPNASKEYFKTVADNTSGGGASTVTEISSPEEFASTISGPGLTVVDYWAPWCRNCKKIAPGVEALAAQHSNVKFVAVNTVDNESIGADNGVEALPTFQFFKSGAKVGEYKGSNLDGLVAAIKAVA